MVEGEESDHRSAMTLPCGWGGKSTGRTASYRLVPLGTAWYRINFFLSVKRDEKNAAAACSSGLRRRNLWGCRKKSDYVASEKLMAGVEGWNPGEGTVGRDARVLPHGH